MNIEEEATTRSAVRESRERNNSLIRGKDWYSRFGESDIWEGEGGQEDERCGEVHNGWL